MELCFPVGVPCPVAGWNIEKTCDAMLVPGTRLGAAHSMVLHISQINLHCCIMLFEYKMACFLTVTVC